MGVRYNRDFKTWWFWNSCWLSRMCWLTRFDWVVSVQIALICYNPLQRPHRAKLIRPTPSTSSDDEALWIGGVSCKILLMIPWSLLFFLWWWWWWISPVEQSPSSHPLFNIFLDNFFEVWKALAFAMGCRLNPLASPRVTWLNLLWNIFTFISHSLFPFW